MTAPNDQAQFSNISATPASFVLLGGHYGISVAGVSANGGSVTLNGLSLDAVTWIAVLVPFQADGFANLSLPAGLYQLALAGATAVYAAISKIRG